MSKEKWTCVGGPLDGREVAGNTSRGFVYLGSRYVMATDDCGERYWRYVGCLAQAA